MIWGQARWDPEGCPPWPAAADCCPPVPTGWRGSCAGRGTSVTWRWLSWLTALPWTALFWSHRLTAAWVRGHSTSKCRKSRGCGLRGAYYPAWAGGVTWRGWVLSCRLGMKLALQALSPALPCHEQVWGGRQQMSALQCYTDAHSFASPAAVSQQPGLC